MVKKLDFDIVIIGSGAGGGTVAKELAPLCNSGAKIALLEWGGNFLAKDNSRQEVKMAERYYFDGGGFLTSSQDMTLAFAKSLGGSTSVYTGVSLKMTSETLESWNLDVSMKDLEPRYQKYILENNVHLVPEEDINQNNKLFAKACRNLGWHIDQFPINTRNCEGLNTCNMGCGKLAKQGTSVVQIPAAQKHGVQVFPFTKVTKIAANKIWAEVMPPQYGLEACELAPGSYEINAKKIVLACGSVQTSALLLRSFGSHWNSLGKYFTCHPAMILAAQHPQPITNTFGHPKSYYSEEFLDSDGVLLETCMYFPFTLAKSLCGFGAEMDSLLSNFDKLQMILLLALDEATESNRIEINRKGEPIVHYSFSAEVIHALVTGMQKSAEIFFESGAELVHVPAAKKFLLRREDRKNISQLVSKEFFKLGKLSISAAHLMGGARMGKSAKEGVCDNWGKVFGVPDLYIADSGLFPNSVGVNPYLTIMAFADRVAEGIKRDLGVQV